MRLSELRAQIEAIETDELNPDPWVAIVLQGVDYQEVVEVTSDKNGDPGSHVVCIIANRDVDWSEA